MRISQSLKEKKEAILKRWEERVRGELPAARDQSTPVLFNELSPFLDLMVRALSSLNPEESALKDREICREHGQQRATLPSYSIEQVIREYGLLRETIFELLEREGQLNQKERDVILSSISHGTCEAASEYVRIQDFVREQFIATLTHDLRNPLTASKTSAELILRQPDKADICQTLAARIIDSLKRVDNMIRDLLDTYQIRSGQRLPLKLEPCDLRATIRNVLDELCTIYGDRFIFDVHDEVNGIWSVEGVRRIVENLSNNAIKYGDSHSPVTVSLKQLDQEVQITVHNFGNSLGQKDLAKLFEPFHRTSSAQSGNRRGWGLGLTLVRGMTEALGGNVSVESSLAQGTTFTVNLPNKRVDVV
jgi:signal transduction histidine kinase